MWPYGVIGAGVVTAGVGLLFELSAAKLVRVVPQIDGKPAAGFVVGHVTSDPEMVEIAGPESSVRRAAAALTETLSVAG